MHRFFSTTIDLKHATLDGPETRHLRDVLRIREGEAIKVFDGKGREFLAVVDSISKHSTSLVLQRETSPSAPESPLDLTLAVALTKGEKFELVIQKAVELGVNKIVPILTKRCDVKPSGNDKRSERWRRIALDASKQTGRARLMEISPTQNLDSLLSSTFPGTKLLFSERGGSALEGIAFNTCVQTIIGPEGGWEDEELDRARSARFDIVTLGGRILRAETAAIAIAAVLQNRFGDLK
jgi:16S rRNA (uracil1498-N3)-methyltransferase